MRYLLLKVLIGAIAPFACASSVLALPSCPGSPATLTNGAISTTWKNCSGKLRIKIGGSLQFSYTGEFRVGENGSYGRPEGFGVAVWGVDHSKKPKDRKKYTGHWKNYNFHGQGLLILNDGTIQEGIFEAGVFKYAQRTPYSKAPSLLRTNFNKLGKADRELVQSNLKNLGFYTSSVDGMYGKDTDGALTKYNKQHLDGADLQQQENVTQLIKAVLGHIKSVKTVQKNSSDTKYKVSSGSGFYVSNQGHLITNHHVIDGCSSLKIHTNGKVFEAKSISDDKHNDLALLKGNEVPKHAFALSNESPFPLQEIVVAGYPFGERVSSTLKFTQGIISSVAGLKNDYSQIQIDAALQPGNSGGPILDEYGNIVAVAVAKLNLKKILEDYGVVPENTNFGVKASAVKNLMEGNGIYSEAPNTKKMSKRELSEIATEGTVFISCWMTGTQIESMRATKLFFNELE